MNIRRKMDGYVCGVIVEIPRKFNDSTLNPCDTDSVQVEYGGVRRSELERKVVEAKLDVKSDASDAQGSKSRWHSAPNDLGNSGSNDRGTPIQVHA